MRGLHIGVWCTVIHRLSYRSWYTCICMLGLCTKTSLLLLSNFTHNKQTTHTASPTNYGRLTVGVLCTVIHSQSLCAMTVMYTCSIYTYVNKPSLLTDSHTYKYLISQTHVTQTNTSTNTHAHTLTHTNYTTCCLVVSGITQCWVGSSNM